METVKAMRQPTVVLLIAVMCSSVLLQETNAQNACETDCVRGIYANNCGQASCITGVSSSEEFNSLCGPACISAISGGGMLDCLTFIGGSTDVQNSFVLTVQNFCAQGDPFAPLPVVVPAESPAEPVTEDSDNLSPAESPAASDVSDIEESPETVVEEAPGPSAESETESEETQVQVTETDSETAEGPASEPVEESNTVGEGEQPEQELEESPASEPAAEPDELNELDELYATGPEAFSSEIGYEYDLFDMDDAVVSIFETGFEADSSESDAPDFASSYDDNTI